MSTVMDQPDETSAATDWRPVGELAPSTMRADEPRLPRLAGMIGLTLILLGAVSWIAAAYGRSTLITPGWATLAILIGQASLLYHAASDSDVQVRRAYMTLGFALLGLGVLLSLVPTKEQQIGGLFLPWSLVGYIWGLLFLMAYSRHETEPLWKDLVGKVIGGVGVLLALIGFVFSNIKLDFLLSYGLVLMLLGLVYWWRFVGMRGTTNDLGYYAATAMGLLGSVALLVALGRSLVPQLLSTLGWINPQSSYFMPAGALLIFCSLLYVALALGLIWDNRLIVLIRRELSGIFCSPIAYIVVFGFAVIAWQMFARFVYDNPDQRGHLWRDEPFQGMTGTPIPQVEPIVINYIIDIFPVICVIFVVPVLTMRLLSEEQRTGTIEVMLTAPLGETAVVLSKFIASFLVFLLVWVPWGLYLVSLRVEGGQSFDYLPIMSFFIALVFTGAGFMSMGLFFSSLTRNQVTAAILTFVGMLTLTFVYFLKANWPITDARRVILEHISYIDLWIHSLEGKLAVRDLLYHLSAAVFWLFLTVKVLESRKWR
jgi:ABC-type transport system involved in multi-copper enzyme maturation permease subunit